jgi:hypothetical protein
MLGTRLEVAATTVKRLSGYQPSSFESYFVRELLAALFFFTVLYVCLVALIARYLVIDHVVHLELLGPGRSCNRCIVRVGALGSIQE